MKKIILSAVTMVAVSTSIFAGGDIAPVEPVVDSPVMASESQNGFYVGLGLSAAAVTNDSLNLFSDETGQERMIDVTLQAGYTFNTYVSLEARYSKSVAKMDTIEREVWGVYVKPQYPVSDAVNVYALLGYGGMNLNPEDTLPVDLSDEGFQWGLGASYDITDNIAVFVDYVNVANGLSADAYPYAGSTKIDSASVTVGLTYKF